VCAGVRPPPAQRDHRSGIAPHALPAQCCNAAGPKDPPQLSFLRAFVSRIRQREVSSGRDARSALGAAEPGDGHAEGRSRTSIANIGDAVLIFVGNTRVR
jgi:hypothetical protein